jgi:hypothetical protein
VREGPTLGYGVSPWGKGGMAEPLPLFVVGGLGRTTWVNSLGWAARSILVGRMRVLGVGKLLGCGGAVKGWEVGYGYGVVWWNLMLA